MFYIDTSVIVAYYCPEPMSEAVEELIIEIKQPAISHLTEIEFASAISRKIREKNLSQTDGNKILTQFQSLSHHSSISPTPKHTGSTISANRIKNIKNKI